MDCRSGVTAEEALHNLCGDIAAYIDCTDISDLFDRAQGATIEVYGGCTFEHFDPDMDVYRLSTWESRHTYGLTASVDQSTGCTHITPITEEEVVGVT